MATGSAGSGGGSAGAVRAGGAFVELFVNDSKLVGGLNAASKKLTSFGTTMAAIGGGIAGVGAAALGGIGAAFKSVVDRGSEFSRLSQRLGDTTENLSAFAYAAETTGQSVEQLSGHWENLAERILQAQTGTGEAAVAFQTLNLDPAIMQAASATEQMVLLSEAMQSITNDTTRRGILSGFGGDQFQGMNELLKKGPEGIRKLMNEAKTVGATVSTKNAADADKIGAAWNRSFAAVKNAIMSVGVALLPQAATIEKWANWAVTAAGSVRAWIAENQTLVLTVTAVSAAAVAFGTVLAGIGVAAAAIGAGLAALPAIIGTVTTVLGAVGAALLSPWVAIPLAIGAAAAAVYAYAGSMDGLRVMWAELTLWMTKRWVDFKNIFVDSWHDMMKWFGDAWASAVNGISNAIIDVAEAVQYFTAEEAAAARKTLENDVKSEDSARKRLKLEEDVARVRARNANIAEAEADLAEAKLNQRRNLLIAAFRGEFAKMTGGGHGGGGLPPSAAGLGSAVRGTFGTAASRLVFGMGTNAIPKQQLDKLGNIERLLTDIRDKETGLLFAGGA